MYPGKAIREIREKLKVRQSTFAAAIGVSEPTLRNWESGRTQPGMKNLPAISTIGINPHHLFDSNCPAYIAGENDMSILSRIYTAANKLRRGGV